MAVRVDEFVEREARLQSDNSQVPVLRRSSGHPSVARAVDARIADQSDRGARGRERRPGVEKDIVTLVAIEVGDAEQLGSRWA
jgi:hypothetical protein